jgi:hypothetical protein
MNYGSASRIRFPRLQDEIRILQNSRKQAGKESRKPQATYALGLQEAKYLPQPR